MLGLAGFGEIEYVRLRYVASNLDHHAGLRILRAALEDLICAKWRRVIFVKIYFFHLLLQKGCFFLIPKLKF